MGRLLGGGVVGTEKLPEGLSSSCRKPSRAIDITYVNTQRELRPVVSSQSKKK